MSKGDNPYSQWYRKKTKGQKGSVLQLLRFFIDELKDCDKTQNPDTRTALYLLQKQADNTLELLNGRLDERLLFDQPTRSRGLPPLSSAQGKSGANISVLTGAVANHRHIRVKEGETGRTFCKMGFNVKLIIKDGKAQDDYCHCMMSVIDHFDGKAQQLMFVCPCRVARTFS